MNKTEGRYKSHPWFWCPDFGVYCCETVPKFVSADTLYELYKVIEEYVA